MCQPLDLVPLYVKTIEVYVQYFAGSTTPEDRIEKKRSDSSISSLFNVLSSVCGPTMDCGLSSVYSAPARSCLGSVPPAILKRNKRQLMGGSISEGCLHFILHIYGHRNSLVTFLKLRLSVNTSFFNTLYFRCSSVQTIHFDSQNMTFIIILAHIDALFLFYFFYSTNTRQE